MRVSQVVLTQSVPQASDLDALAAIHPQLILAFGSVDALKAGAGAILQIADGAQVAGCSTAGEISGEGVTDGALVLTAVAFDHCRVSQVSTELNGMNDSHAAGRRLAEGLQPEGLRALMIFGQGVQINGSAVLAGMVEVVGKNVPITGGLAGDGGAFEQTWVLDNQGLSSNRLVCIGLYGASLQFSHGSFGGWLPFGPARRVTRCESNVLYELDGEPALTVYKRYLGEHAKTCLPRACCFPLPCWVRITVNWALSGQFWVSTRPKAA